MVVGGESCGWLGWRWWLAAMVAGGGWWLVVAVDGW